MSRLLPWTIAAIALLLVPVSLWLALFLPHDPIAPTVALWAPIIVLALDALLFFVAFGLWNLTAWERTGLAFILPLLIAIASWAAMMGGVSAQIPGG